jgi:hypothetical protein
MFKIADDGRNDVKESNELNSAAGECGGPIF